MEALQLALLLITSCVLTATADDHGDNAPHYTADNFSDKIASHPHFVMFFAPWCGHCKHLAPTWDKLAKKYNADPDKYGATIAMVDCTSETGLCKNNEVSGYPTLKFFKSENEVERYRGGRDQGALEKFIQEQLGRQVQEEPQEQEEAKEEKEVEEEEEEKKEEKKILKNVVDLTGDSFEGHVQRGFHFVKFYAPWCPHCQRLEETWEKLGTAFVDDNDVSISRMDCTEHRVVCTNNAVAGYPTLAFFQDGEKVDKYTGGRDIESLKSYVTKMMNKDKADKDATEERIPEDREPQPGEVLNLNEDNFQEVIQTGTTFVKFFAPWCGHCKRLAPTWDDLGKKFADHKNVKIAKIDCTTDREVCTQHGVRGFPTLILFRDGVKTAEHNGGRDLDALANFIVDQIPRDEL